VPSARLIEVPPEITDEVDCQTSLNPVRAWALLQESRARSGDWILVTAATSTASNIVGAMGCTADYVFPADVTTVTADIWPKLQEETELRLCSIAWADGP
jgi:hypothetical protein